MSLIKIIPGVLELAHEVIDRTIPDKDAANRAKAELSKIELQGELSNRAEQLKINQVEAAHKSVFVAGWRPAVGWICVLAMGYHFIFYPFFGSFIEHYMNMDMIDLDWPQLQVVLMGILGLGAARSYEKAKGVSREN